MIDAHEDVFARNFCGERVPYFYVNKMGYDQKCDANVMTRILGLFGVCKTLSYYNFTYDENGLPLNNVVKLCEENFISWSYWNYKPYGDHTTSAIELVEYEGIYNDDGTIQNIKEKGLSRSYVQYYQGKPIDFKFEINSDSNFETCFVFDKNISEPSVLYYNKDYFYKKGYFLEIINEETKENLLESKAIIIDENIPNYIFIKGNKSILEDKTKIRIIFKSIE